jgi:hypothetical protein
VIGASRAAGGKREGQRERQTCQRDNSSDQPLAAKLVVLYSCVVFLRVQVIPGVKKWTQNSEEAGLAGRIGMGVKKTASL